MWNDASHQHRESEVSDTNPARIGFVDAKGMEWKVLCRYLPERHGRVSLSFASANGKRRNAEVRAAIDDLRSLDDHAWRGLLANAAVFELE
jgi:hypothetical protein